MKQIKHRKKAKAAPLNDVFQLRGYLEYVLRDAVTGELVRRGKKENTVSFWGRGLALARMVATSASSGGSVLSALAIGASSTAPNASNTNLVDYQTIKVFGTTGLTTATNGAGTFTASVSFNSDQTFGNNSHGEFALYNSGATGGGAVMFNRLNTNPVINFASTNTLAITVTITN